MRFSFRATSSRYGLDVFFLLGEGVCPGGGPYIPTPFRQGHWPDVGHSASLGGRRILGPLLSNGILENDGQLKERTDGSQHVVVIILAVGGVYIA